MNVKNEQILIAGALSNIPWQDKPCGSSELVWRYDNNPVIRRNPLPGILGAYNSAVVPYKGAFVGVFRCDYMGNVPQLHLGRSADGIDWQLDPYPIDFQSDDDCIVPTEYAYDPRVCRIDDKYYISWCGNLHGPTIGLAYTSDFKDFYQLPHAFLPFNRNGVLFPRMIDGKYFMLSRPSDNGHTPFGDIFLSESPDMTYWGRHRHVMGTDSKQWWQSVKIGGGPVPIETTEGWLIFYHGVMSTCNGYVYSMGAALLDIEKPWKVLCRTDEPLLVPVESYEVTGKVSNVVFPCAALCDSLTGRISIYYGAADTYLALAFCNAEEIIGHLKSCCAV